MDSPSAGRPPILCELLAEAVVMAAPEVVQVPLVLCVSMEEVGPKDEVAESPLASAETATVEPDVVYVHD